MNKNKKAKNLGSVFRLPESAKFLVNRFLGKFPKVKKKTFLKKRAYLILKGEKTSEQARGTNEMNIHQSNFDKNST